MNLFRKLFILFGREYVILKFDDGRNFIKPVTIFDNIYICAPYSEDTNALLYPNGKLEGRSYIKEWIPITKKMKYYYHSNIKSN